MKTASEVQQPAQFLSVTGRSVGRFTRLLSVFRPLTENERERAVKTNLADYRFRRATGRTLIVMHLGEIRMKPVTDSLIKLARKGELLSRKYVREKIRAVEKREAASATHLDRVKGCLRRIVDYAVSKKVKPGSKAAAVTKKFRANANCPRYSTNSTRRRSVIGTNFGHIQIKENLALLDHAEWLRQIGPRTFGCHVQDCIWPAQDHQPPFSGDVDLAKLVRCCRKIVRGLGNESAKKR